MESEREKKRGNKMKRNNEREEEIFYWILYVWW
jgi:hypothetical protein